MADAGTSATPGSTAPHAGGTAPVGRTTDAFGSLAETFSSEARQLGLGRSDPRVSVAFALGWQVAEIYRPDRGGAPPPPASQDDLPGLSRLSEAEWTEIGLDQVQAGIAKLFKAIFEAGLDPPDAQFFASTLNAAPDDAARRQAIREFHVDLLAILTAADFRLGKAYSVGRALADTTRPPVDYLAELAPRRVATIAGWIRALATALPPHASHPVADSLEAWSRWAHPQPAQERINVDVTVAKLGAQGRLWRSLLSAEKRPTDTLETSDYVRAGEGVLRRFASLAWQFLKHYWWLVLVIVVLFAAGVVVVAISSSPGAVVGGSASILAALGLGWKGAGGSLGREGARVEEPLWGAALDKVIYERITPQTIVDSQSAVKRGPDEPSLAAR